MYFCSLSSLWFEFECWLDTHFILVLSIGLSVYEESAIISHLICCYLQTKSTNQYMYMIQLRLFLVTLFRLVYSSTWSEDVFIFRIPFKYKHPFLQCCLSINWHVFPAINHIYITSWWTDYIIQRKFVYTKLFNPN